MNTVIVEASQPQHVPAGRLLGKMYYSGFLDVLSHDESWGYPHNGGRHTLVLKMVPGDLSSFLNLVQEQYAQHEGLTDFVSSVRAQFSKSYPKLQAI